MEAIRWAQCQRVEKGRDELKLRLDQSLANGVDVREALGMPSNAATLDVIVNCHSLRDRLIKAEKCLAESNSVNAWNAETIKRLNARAEKAQLDSVNQGLEIARLKGELAKERQVVIDLASIRDYLVEDRNRLKRDSMKHGWIPISTPPTEADGVKLPGRDAQQIIFLHASGAASQDWNETFRPPNGTHWTRIPPLPIEEKKGTEQPEKELVECDCNCTDICPQGHTGAAAKCEIWQTVRPIK